MRAMRVAAAESDREDYEALVTAARLFYIEGLTQEKVARELGLSQSSVSRLLERARREGIVKAHTYFNVLVTDEKIARYLLDGR